MHSKTSSINGKKITASIADSEDEAIYNKIASISQIKREAVLVITGNLASGKSTACKILAERGYPVISADEINKRLLNTSELIKNELSAHFGSGLLDQNNNINFSALRSRVLSSPDALGFLEAVMHPQIKLEAEKLFQTQYKQGSRLIIYESPLFFEARLNPADYLAVVSVCTAPETSISRAVLRGRITADDARKVLSRQLPWHEKSKLSTFTINNSGSLEQLATKIDGVLAQLKR